MITGMVSLKMEILIVQSVDLFMTREKTLLMLIVLTVVRVFMVPSTGIVRDAMIIFV